MEDYLQYPPTPLCLSMKFDLQSATTSSLKAHIKCMKISFQRNGNIFGNNGNFNISLERFWHYKMLTIMTLKWDEINSYILATLKT